jgi:tetratricopeptide (TPR) repeat protein
LNRFIIYLLTFSCAIGVGLSCVTTKKRNETSKVGKFYHNTTAYYNGYWNATEIMKESLKKLRDANVDDYNNILEVEDFVSLDNPKLVKSEMDKILDKVSTVAQLHLPSDWVDDCYVMMGKAQYVKQEYETANETLEYFQEDFNPANPYGRNYKSKKLTGKAAKKAKDQEKKVKDAERKKATAEKEVARKEQAKTKAQERKEKAKEQAKAKKEREKQRKIDANNRKKGIKTTKTPAETTKPVKQDSITAPVKPLVKSTPIENESVKAPEPPKTEQDKTAYSEGLLWLAKVYIKRQNWFPAQMILEKLKPEMLTKEARTELAPTYANYYIKQQKYEEAIPKLAEAIETAPNKDLKARYAFIAGQISQLLNKNSDALKYFEIAKSSSNNPKMEFMAEMAVAKNAISSGTKSKDEVLKTLKKNTSEAKYASLKDEIYYTMGEIELSQNNEKAAIENFQNSVYNNNTNQKLKTEAYYKIANIHYKAGRYLPASTYYDSTFMFLANTDPRYDQIKRYVDNLKDIAYNIHLINYSDTLLYFASLDEKDRKKAVLKYLEKNPKSLAPPAPKTLSPTAKSGGVIISRTDFGNSTFFAYNTATKERGRQAFIKTWGNIPLEDDWRRSEKISFASVDNHEAEDKVEEQALADKVSQDDYNALNREIPTNPIKLQEVNDRIMASMFTLGKLFRDKIENYAKSAETLETMHNRYGPTPNELDSYFYLYLDYLDLGNKAKQEEYKSKILNKYPESKYATVINDPDYFNKAKSSVNKADKYYSTMYKLFTNGQYAQVEKMINDAPNVMGPDHQYNAKMSLLYAMCKGNTEGKEAYIRELNKVVTSYPGSPEQLKAKEILRFLGGDNNAFANVQDVDKIYTRDATSTHYVAVITYGLDDTQHLNFKIAISEYNKKNFAADRLQFGDAILNIENNEQIILVRKFDNEEKAIAYYNKVLKDAEEYSGNVKYTYDILPISQNNYRKMMSERSAKGYRVFLENSILNNY